jgi:hypothetical protein
MEEGAAAAGASCSTAAVHDERAKQIRRERDKRVGGALGCPRQGERGKVAVMRRYESHAALLTCAQSAMARPLLMAFKM